MDYGGYVGKLLRVNLSSGKISEMLINKEFADKWMGGRGFAAKILFDELKPRIDPLSPANKLIFITGPLCGTGIPLTGKFAVATKSPLTNTISVGYGGGYFGPIMKRSGYDGVIFEGKSRKPLYVSLDDGTLTLRNAEHLWGKDVHKTEELVKNEIGEQRARVAAIGPAGENLVRFASIVSDKHAAVARCGPGAVMGSKNLKAFAVFGTQKVNTYVGKDVWQQTLKWIGKIVDTNEVVKSFNKFGTTGSVAVVNEMGLNPTRNFQFGVFEGIDAIDGDYIKKKYPGQGFVHCWGCRVLCSKWIRVKQEPNGEIRTDRPEHENIFALGSNCGISSFEAIAHANFLCDKYGMDTISTGVAISFAMECYERGILSERDTDGLELRFGRTDALIGLIEKIARKEGIGGILAEGVMRAAKRIGKGAENYAMHVKGLEMPGYDPRGAKGIGLNYATASRGADHNDGWTIAVEVFGIPVQVDRFSEDEKKVRWVVDFQNFTAAPIDSAVFCNFCLDFGFDAGVIERLVQEAIGMRCSYAEMVKIGERIINLERLFNLREGYSRKDDSLPGRFLEPMPEGASRGQTCNVDRMLNAYYNIRGWDREGTPTKEKLELLDLV